MKNVRRSRALLFIAGWAVFSTGMAQNPAMTFEQGCPQDTVEAGRSTLLSKLAEVESALAAGDYDLASLRIYEAEGATVSVAGWTGSLLIKCQGESIFRRYFTDWQKVKELQARNEPDNREAQLLAALWKAVNDNSRGADTVVDSIPVDARSYKIGRATLRSIPETTDYMREIGAFVLPEEDKLAQIALQGGDIINVRAAEYSAAALAKEPDAFFREPTDDEKAAMASIADIGQLAGAMAGIDINSAAHAEFMMLDQRAGASLLLLDEARVWNFNDYAEGQRAPEDRRGEERGDEIFVRGDNKEIPATIRDEYYALALRFFNWCSCDERSDAVTAARDAIEPEILAEEERRRVAAEKAEAEMKQQAEQMQQAVDDMQKTESEKQSFKDEADALEAELGF